MKMSSTVNAPHVTIDGEHLTLEDVHLVSREHAQVAISLEAYEKVKKSREIVQRFLDVGKPIYGVNTGFGALANIRISKEKLKELQKHNSLTLCRCR